MKVSEKTVELNAAAEILEFFRRRFDKKAFLVGLAQRQEKKWGMDNFIASGCPSAAYAFQFKATRNANERLPYKFKIELDQHTRLYTLSQQVPRSIFYVFPFYYAHFRVYRRSPNLLADTWFLNVDQMVPTTVFNGKQSRTVSCIRGRATINPEFDLIRLQESDRLENLGAGISGEFLRLWYESGEFDEARQGMLQRGHQNGLYFVVVRKRV